jgi:general secretion pathway protein I
MRFFVFRPNPAATENGFTLIETLVAIMILSISLVVIMQLFSGGLKSNKISSDYLHGIFHAKEKMEELLVSSALLPGTYAGTFDDGYRWEAIAGIVEEPAETEEDAGISEKMPVALMRIDLTVSWKTGVREKYYRLSTTQIVDKKAIGEAG